MEKIALVASFAAFIFLILIIVKKNVKKRYLKAFGIFLGIVFLISLGSAFSAPGQFRNAFFTGIINTLKIFSLDADYEQITVNLFGDQDHILLRLYVEMILFVAPIVGGAAVLTVISDIFPTVKYKLRGLFSTKMIIFSYLNSQSYMMAEELIREGKVARNCVLVFCNTWIEEGNEDELNLLERAKELDATVISLRRSLTDLVLPQNAKIDLYFVRDNDVRNIEEAILYTSSKKEELTRHKKTIRAFVFAQSELAPDILENIYENVDPDNQTEFDIAVVPYKTNAVYRVLLDTPMFRFYKKAYDEEELFKIAVIGDNEWAVEIIKACFWCCQLPRKRVSLVSFSEDPDDFTNKISAAIPGLDLNSDNPYADVCFLGIDQYGKDIDHYICEEKSIPTVWFLTGENDDATLDLGNYICETIGSHTWQQTSRGLILCQLDNEELSAVINGIHGKAVKDRKVEDTYLIKAFGSLKEQYSPSYIYDELSELGWMLNRNWSQFFSKGNQDVKSAEYNRRSSRAAALHIAYKIYSLGMIDRQTGGSLSDYIANSNLQKGLTDRQKQLVGLMEHKRWNAYMLTERYKKAEIDKWVHSPDGTRRQVKETKNLRYRLHTCLVEAKNASRPLGEYLKKDNDPDVVIQQLLSKADQDFAEGVIDELDRVSIYLYNHGYAYGDQMKIFDEDSIDDVLKYQLLYDSTRFLGKTKYYSIIDNGEIDAQIKQNSNISRLAEDLVNTTNLKYGTSYRFKTPESAAWNEYLASSEDKTIVEFIKRLYEELEL